MTELLRNPKLLRKAQEDQRVRHRSPPLHPSNRQGNPPSPPGGAAPLALRGGERRHGQRLPHQEGQPAAGQRLVNWEKP